MDKDKTIVSYNEFLKGLDYKPELVEKYFDNLVNSLKEDLFKFEKSGDEELQKAFEEYYLKEAKYDEIKEEIRKSYENEKEKLISNYKLDILNLENTANAKISEINDRIEFDKNNINQIKLMELKNLRDAIKIPSQKIRDINKRISEEYTMHADSIFRIREELTRVSQEFYINSDNHIKEIDKLLRFFKEIEEYGLELRRNITPSTIESSQNRINLYVEFISENKLAWTNIQGLLDEFGIVKNTFTNIYDELSEREKEKTEESIKLKVLAKEKLDSLNEAIKNTEANFNELLNSDIDKKRKNFYLKEKEAILSKFNSDRVSLAMKTSIESTILNKEEKYLSEFHDKLVDLNANIYDTYTSTIKKNNDELIETINQMETILIDTKKGIERINGGYIGAQNLLIYFEKRYSTLCLNKRIDALNLYKEYILKSVKSNKEMDVLAFELLTSDEVKTLKLLELEREYLCIDENVKINEMRYDIEKKEMEETLDLDINIENNKAEIDLIRKDLEIDKAIKTHEFENEIKHLDLKYKVDTLRVDYMSAYNRLDNVKLIIGIKDKSDSVIGKINTQIRIQNMIEIALLECISRKEAYDDLIKKCDDDLKELDLITKEKIRYQNNVLEIERNLFEENKKRINDTHKELRQGIYPEILGLKKDTYDRIKHIKNTFDKAKKNEKEENKNKEKNYKEALLSFNEIFSSSNKAIDNSYKEDDGDDSPYYSMVDSSKYTDQLDLTLNKYIQKVNSILSENSLEPLEAKQINTSSFKQTLKSTKRKDDRLDAYKDIKKKYKDEILRIKKQFIKKINEKLPDDKKSEEQYLSIYDEMMKSIVAQEAIKGNEKLSPYLDDLETLDKSRQEVLKEKEDHLKKFKEQYLQTIKTIDKEYNDKLDQLNTFKNSVIEKNDTSNQDIDLIIHDATLKLRENRDEVLKKKDTIRDVNYKNRESKIASLQGEVNILNKDIENSKKEIDDSNKLFRDDKAQEAKDDYANYQLFKEKNQQMMKDRILSHDENREEYIKNISIDALNTKEKYQDRKEKIIETEEMKKADTLMEFERIYSSIRQNVLPSHDSISAPFIDFEKEVEKITNELIKESEAINNRITEFSKEEYDKTLKNIGEKANLNERDREEN